MKPQNLLMLIFVVALGLGLTSPLWAADDVNTLKQKINMLEKKVAALESQVQEQGNNERPTNVQPDLWDPQEEIDRLNHEMNWMFQDAFNNVTIPRNGALTNRMLFESSGIENTKNEYLIKLDVPDFDKNKIKVDINANSLSVTGEYNAQQQEKNKQSAYESHSYGKFLETFPLPKGVDTSKIRTEQKGDQLIIHLPKKSA